MYERKERHFESQHLNWCQYRARYKIVFKECSYFSCFVELNIVKYRLFNCYLTDILPVRHWPVFKMEQMFWKTVDAHQMEAEKSYPLLQKHQIKSTQIG